jgi:hypothetical protein
MFIILVKLFTANKKRRGNISVSPFFSHILPKTLPRASGLLSIIAPTFPHDFISGQPPQFSNFFSSAHCLIGHKDSQYTVFAPGIRQPEQLIISGVISTPLSADHSFDTFIRSSLSLFMGQSFFLCDAHTADQAA